MRNTTLYKFDRLENTFSLVDALRLARAGVNDDDVMSLRFVFHVMEKPTFIGSIKKMANMQIEYMLQDSPGDYSHMVLSMQLVVGDMLRESNESKLFKIEVEVERI